MRAVSPVAATFCANGNDESSDMTEVNPALIARTMWSTDLQWSRCRAIGVETSRESLSGTRTTDSKPMSFR